MLVERLPAAVDIVEVAPRDGLQNEAVLLSTAAKVELITRAVDAGARRIEACAFVNPARVPAMADAEAVMSSVPRDGGVSYSGLVLNRRGYQRAVAAGVDEVNVVVVATDTFGVRNQGMTTEQALGVWETVATLAHRDQVRPTLTIAAAFGCPFEGEVSTERVASIARRAASAGPAEIALADTIGVAVPTDVAERVDLVAEIAPQPRLRCHFHNTRNTGYANAVAALQHGVRVLDSSLGGIGGCPFAPEATGNIATEDLLYLLGGMGVATGMSLSDAAAAGVWIGQQLGRQSPAQLGRVAPFPPRRLIGPDQ